MRTLVPHIRSQTFTVPAGAGAYAPEVLYCALDNDPRKGLDCVERLRAFVRSVPATATVEIDLLKPANADPRLDASWNLGAGASALPQGLTALLELAGWLGVRIRVVSGGTAGQATVDAAWLSL